MRLLLILHMVILQVSCVKLLRFVLTSQIVPLIAGNIATAEGARAFYEAGVDVSRLVLDQVLSVLLV